MRKRLLSQLFRASALGAALIATGGAALPLPSYAAAPQIKVQAPGYYRFMLGDFEVTVLSDGTIDLPIDKLLHGPAAAIAAGLKKSDLSSPVETSVNAFLINTGTRLILVDTGAGALFGPTLGKLLANLRASGYGPEQVDDVLLTHIHPDHVGGLAADGRAMFPNATVHVDRRDTDFWLSKDNLDKAPADSKGFFQGAVASLSPYVPTDRLKTFDGSGEVLPGIRAESSYGHTAGHSSYIVESRGQRLILIGDLIHVGAVQLDSPQVTIAYDSDEKQAASARAKVFEETSEDGALVGAAHLSFPGIGRILSHGKAWEWLPVNYTNELH
jgi:glyoxylase-like metal-dependent hydrolase (beta-lactamase superfamily II)